MRTANADDREALVRTKVAAFLDDPVEQWLFPEPATREHVLCRAYRVGLRDDLKARTTWCTDDLLSFATWRKSTERQANAIRSTLSQLSLVPILPRLGPPVRTLLTLGRLFVEHRPPGTHWRLTSLGTHPSARREGRAAALVEVGLARCDGDALPCSIVSTNLDNVDFYQRFGFEVTAEVRLPHSGPLVAVMTRRVRGE